MKTKLLKFSDIKAMLSEDEMKKVFGGSKSQWACKCSVMPGQWSGNYSSQDQIAKAIRSYCSVGGECERNILIKEPAQSHITETVSDDGMTTTPSYILVFENK